MYYLYLYLSCSFNKTLKKNILQLLSNHNRWIETTLYHTLNFLAFIKYFRMKFLSRNVGLLD